MNSIDWKFGIDFIPFSPFRLFFFILGEFQVALYPDFRSPNESTIPRLQSPFFSFVQNHFSLYSRPAKMNSDSRITQTNI